MKKIKILFLIICTASISYSQRIRKEWSELTNQERLNYVNALSSLDASFVQEMWSQHNDLADDGIHSNMWGSQSFGNVTEGGFDFLPWHRLFLLEMENRLRATGYPNLTIPYWNWYNVWDENSDLFGNGYKREEHILNV